MPCETKPRFVVLYGSQKGQAQSLAECIADGAEEHGLVADLYCLDQNEKYNLEKETSPVVFVVSTTGDGDPPDNAVRFVKRIKAKTLPANHYEHLCYALLALGDTNYSNFCDCGKTIERRLKELGAKQFYSSGYADDGIGLELVVEPWLDGLWSAINKAASKMASETTAQDTTKEIPETSKLDLQLSLLSFTDQKNSETSGEDAQTDPTACTASSSSFVVPASKSNSGVASETENTNLALQTDAVPSRFTSTPGTHTKDDEVPQTVPVPSLMTSLPPLSESSLNIPALPPPYLDVTLEDKNVQEQNEGPLDRDSLHNVPISNAVQLSKGNAVKTALLLELDISSFPTMSYEPGDSFNVFCPNRTAEVNSMLSRLDLQEQRNHCVNVTLMKDTKKKGAQIPSHVPQNASLFFLLTWCLEIRSVPKKALVRALVEHTADSSQKRRLQELCSKQGATDYNLYVRDTNLSVLELLMAFPSCSPPISLLIEHLPKLQPRPYSAASSRLRHPGKLHFVFNVLEFPGCFGRPAGRRGLCTGWLFDLINSSLVFSGKAEPSSSLALPTIHVGLRPNCSFRPPSDSSVPFVMVGPGTGVAPFIGFLQQRAEERKANPEVEFGQTWLFFGCRHRDGDYLFREELEDFVSSGTLSHLKVCFSRDEGQSGDGVQSAAKPRYVQENLLLYKREVADILLRQNGCFYVCGDAKNMAKDVNETLLGIIREELLLDQLEAMKKVAELREEKRYLQDIWG